MSLMIDKSGALPELVLDSVNAGVYVTDLERRIIYWNHAAEQITGWRAEQIVGKHCHDGVLCHIDKDGHVLCGEEHCPLHRSMLTGRDSMLPIVVFAQTSGGSRVPLQVSVAPLRNAIGEVVGGVETFRDLSQEFSDLNRSRKIQRLALQSDMPVDPRIRFTAHYIPNDVIGGDYYAIARIDADRYGFLVADVMGHGVPAALYTMYLSSIWTAQQGLLGEPERFAQVVGDSLYHLIQEKEPFAAGLCGVFDLKRQELRLVGAGNPPPLIVREDGRWQQPEAHGLPLGLMEGASYEEVLVPLNRNDRALFFTDGAIEISTRTGENLGVQGLIDILQEAGYPEADPTFNTIEAKLLAASDRIRFDDDVTFLEARIA